MKLVIPGDPIAQTRMKYSARGGFGRIYDPRAKDKNHIKALIKNLYEGELLQHPHISFIFHMPIPKSLPKKIIPLYQEGFLKHEKKPDVDNFVKLYLDCMDGIVFDGDQRVSLGACIKVYHPHPKTIIFLNETTQSLQCSQVSQEIWYDLCE